MKKLLFIFLVLISFKATAQTTEKTIDPFTNKVLKTASASIGGITSPFAKMTIAFNYIGEKKYISFSCRTGTGMLGSFNDKTKDISLLFKLDNDSVFRFKVDTVYAKIGTSETSNILIMRASISEHAIYNFATHQISKFRIGIKDDSGVDLDDSRLLTDHNKNQVQKAAAFMLDMKVIPEEQN